MILEQKNRKKNSERRTFFRRSSSFFAAEMDTFRIQDKSLGRYRKSLPKEGISLYNDSDYNRKVTIQSPISIPLTLHLDVASRHMKRKKTAHSCKHDSQFSSILHGSESLHMKKKTIRRSENSNTTEEGEFMHEYFKCRTSVPWLRRPCDF